MLMDPMGGIVTTNDGNCILREIMVQDPAAKSMIETARSIDEEVGDGTTSVIILAGEAMEMAKTHLQDNMHPTKIISAYRSALEAMVEILEQELAMPVDMDDLEQVTSGEINIRNQIFIRIYGFSCLNGYQSSKNSHLEG